MTRREFESMTIRNGESITETLYNTIEHFYMSENDYHRENGGIDENKRDFCARVFGGKVNTAASILRKITAEAQKENRYALRGNPHATAERLAEMDAAIANHLKWEARTEY